MNPASEFIAEHRRLTRRFFLQLGATAPAVTAMGARGFADAPSRSQVLQKALAELEDYFTRQDDFRDVSRGKPVPHKLSDDDRTANGLTRDTWKLDVVSDPDHPADLENPLSAETGNPFDWDGLMKLAAKHAVRFPKVMTCNNIGCPLGMGIWEGVPLRELVWLTQPQKNLRRVFYHGFHNNDPKQMFRSSLPVGRVLEDPFGLPPVILCYKLNGDWLTAERGGPVRMLVPEAYGFKSVKWLNRLVLTNLSHANDTYAEKNNDIDSHLKTFAATLFVPGEVQSGEPIPITGYSQVGISGLSRIQTWIYPKDEPRPANDPYLQKGDWKDAEILAPPTAWGGDLPDNRIPDGTRGFDDGGQPKSWPLRLAKAHWATVIYGLPAGRYTLRCRSIDANGVAQPLPRPFDKSGRNSIERKSIVVKG